MKITYEATIDDAAEPALRHFLRSKTAKIAKIRSTLIGAVTAAAVVVIFFRSQQPLVFGMAAAAALLGAFINHYFYTPTATKNIRKYIERETEGSLPATTTFWFEDGNIMCDFLGSTISFPLSSLQQVSEDKQRLEISFGIAGLCVIPLRAFTSPDQKAAFLESLKTRHLAPSGN